ncbi:MAG: Clp protease ClpP, partial [Alistipes sp.]|nr:Clp protease ClpP [Alistipes sp.]
AENNGCGRWLSPEETIAAGLADAIVDTTEKPATESPRNIVRGWEKLLAHLGIRPAPHGDPLPADRNILHFDDDRTTTSRRASVAAEEAFRHAEPTRTRAVEDPGYSDALRTANQRAYAADARLFRK